MNNKNEFSMHSMHDTTLSGMGTESQSEDTLAAEDVVIVERLELTESPRDDRRGRIDFSFKVTLFKEL